jgi:hypothetical protein
MSCEHPTQEELVREALLGLMRDISENCWCAHWLNGLEFTLWDAMLTGNDNLGFGIRECELVRLKHLHDMAGGWWIWANDEEDQRFVTTEEWLEIYAKAQRTVPQEQP